MSIHMRQELRMSQQLVMTPQLQQAIKLLQLSRMELQDLVRDELLENPLLEEQQEMSSSTEEPISPVELQDSVELELETSNEIAPQNAELTQELRTDASSEERFDWDRYLQDYQTSDLFTPLQREDDEEMPSLESTATRPETLADHLLWQIRLSNFLPSEEFLAEHIVQNLSSAGYLRGVTVFELAERTGFSVSQVEQTLRKIHQLDPIAIGTRNLGEALWVQAHHPDHKIQDPLVFAIIAKHLQNLEKRAYPAIAKDMGESLEEVYEATKILMSLEPRPARAYIAEDSHYVVPDVYIQKVGTDYVVSLNDDGLPKLKISNLYKSALANKSGAKDYISDKLRAAQWLIRSIHQRQRTIMKVAKSILKFQRDFFDKGVEHLKPLVLKAVADDIEMHESTVSRVTTNKYIHTPQGTFELKFFFNAGISRGDGDDLASEAVKQKISQLIGHENAKRPLSDQKLVELLKQDGIDIARRTVAKYREQLGMQASSRRRKHF